jgi:mannose-6-phosphate isomerase
VVRAHRPLCRQAASRPGRTAALGPVPEKKDETSYLFSGRLLLHRGDSADSLVETELAAGAVWRNQPGQVHTIEALEDSVVVEVSTPELDDVVRLTDDYGRAGTSAP